LEGRLLLTLMPELIVFIVAIAAGVVSAVTGFGIGSLLTPLLALRVDLGVAVAAVAVPHVIGTALRFFLLKGRIDRKVLLSFGITSAAGGLIGALLNRFADTQWLTLLFGALLLFAAASELSGLARRMRFHGAVAWIAGGLSGLLGGLVGNQGGIRSAALIGFNLSKETFVATATAVALFVDGARLPVYIVTQGDQIASLWRPIAVASIGVLLGTLIGSRTLARIPEVWFRRILAVVLWLLGITMIVRGLAG
jgi:uncharacterized membrane protein YfcA